MSHQPPKKRRRAYRKPRLIVYGGITQLTRGADPNASNDPMGAFDTLGKSK